VEPDQNDTSALFAELYKELKLRAHAIRRSSPHVMLDTTSLVHETFLKLVQSKHQTVDREHLARTAAMAMRQILIDHIRGEDTQKRGGDSAHITLTDVPISAADKPERLTQLIEAMEQLRQVNARMCDTFSLRVFAGLTLEEIAELQNVSHMTCARDYQTARAFLLSLVAPG
jgi:RNA polymerase sigma factor (TIGR02999 family)